MSDSPARRPASGSCCGGPWGGASEIISGINDFCTHPETGGVKLFSRSMIPPGALLKKAPWLGHDGKLAPLRDAQTYNPSH